eukprot:1370330-Amorphochlora_amoeboformis.AAC.1
MLVPVPGIARIPANFAGIPDYKTTQVEELPKQAVVSAPTTKDRRLSDRLMSIEMSPPRSQAQK